jgi:hypothetical protein
MKILNDLVRNVLLHGGALRRALTTRRDKVHAFLVDTCIGGVYRTLYEAGEADSLRLGQIEAAIVRLAKEIASGGELGTEAIARIDDQLFALGEVDILDPESPFALECRRWKGQPVGEIHQRACNIISSTEFVFSPERFEACCQIRSTYDLRTERGCDQNGYMNRRVKRAIASHIKKGNTPVTVPYSNLDYRMRRYATLLVSITLGKKIRGCFLTPEPYAVDEELLEVMVIWCLMGQFGLTPDDAAEIVAMGMVQAVVSGRCNEEAFACCDEFMKAKTTGYCSYWGSFDAMSSGIVIAEADVGLAEAALHGDRSHPGHEHAGTTYLRECCSEIPELMVFEPDNPVLKPLRSAALSALQFGAGPPGVYKALTGQKFDEDADDVDWDNFLKVHELLRQLNPTDDPNAFNTWLMELADGLAAAYERAYPALKAAESTVQKRFSDDLDRGVVPSFTTPSGEIIHGALLKRTEGTHQVNASYQTTIGRRKSGVFVSNKTRDPDKLKMAAFSWVIHTLDAEIISYVSIELDELGVPHFTNHDCVYAPLWAYKIVNRLMAEAINKVTAARVLVNQFGCEDHGPAVILNVDGEVAV